MPVVKVRQITPYVIMRTKSISATFVKQCVLYDLGNYILPVLLWVDLLQATYKIAKEEDDVLLIHAIIGIVLALCPVVNLVFLVLVIRAVADMSGDDWTTLAKYSIVFKILFRKI